MVARGSHAGSIVDVDGRDIQHPCCIILEHRGEPEGGPYALTAYLVTESETLFEHWRP